MGKYLGTSNLVLIASLLLLSAIPIVLFLNSTLKKTHEQGDHAHELQDKPIGGSLYSGFVEFATNKRLLGIGIFIFIFTGISAFVYFAQKNVLVGFDRDTRTQIWAGLDLAVNIMTFVVGIFLTNQLVKRFGVSTSLSIVPFLVMAGLLVIAGIPSVTMVVALQFIRKVGNYAVTRPSREMLFTTIDSDSRFKAKPVIDIVIYRGGDVFWAWAFAFLTGGLKLSLPTVMIIGGFIATVWGIIGLRLGRSFENDEERAEDDVSGLEVKEA